MRKDAEYNGEQKAAIETQESIAINAGPGTGKTKTLVGRYIELARRESYDFSRIVAITFTKNAAIELMERISENIPGEKFLDFISDARIGTIHSFCDSIMREHAPALGMSPGFTILEENQPLIGSVVDDLLNAKSLIPGANDPKLDMDIFDNFRKSDLKRLLMSFLLLRPMHTIKHLSYEEYVALSEKALDYLVSEDLAVLADLLRSLPPTSYIYLLLQEIESYPSLDLWGKGTVIVKLSKIDRRDLQIPGTKDELRQWYMLGQRELALLRKQEIKGEKETLKEITQVKNRIKKVCDACHLEELDMEYEYGIYSIMCELFKAVENRYQEAKKDIVDFDDMLLRTKKLLEDKGVAEEEGSRISHLLVDEFQDVDRVQSEIFRDLLGGSLKEKLTIVGDPKQAIYSFRGGEMNIFNEINKEIKTKSLNRSYRSTPRLINFFNLVSKVSFCGNEYSPEHQELSTDVPSGQSTVSFDLVMEESESTDEDDALGEMSLIIPRIAEMQKRGIEPGNMAILLDSRTELTELVDTLTDAQIQFEVISGEGFFEVPEVKCMIALIDFLYDVDDDSALYALLRSPMFGLSDRDIYEISLEQEKSLYKKLRLHNPEIYEELERCRALVDRKNLSQIIEELICRTNYRGILAGSRRGSTAVNNVEKFISRLREMEGSGVRSIYAIRKEIKGAAEAGTREGEANVPQSNCIKVMTIHAAKGLEFDVVFIPYLYKRYNMRNEDVVFHRGFVGLKINVTRFSPYKKDTIIRRGIIKEIRKIEAEEKKRLLYVAMTRARKHVVFTGKKRITGGEIKNEKASKKQNTWSCEVFDPLFEKISGDSLSQIALDEYLKNKNEVHIDIVWDKDEIRGIEVVDRVTEDFEASEINPPGMELVEMSVQQKVKIDPSAVGDIYECPAKYLISNTTKVRKELFFVKSISLNKNPDGMFYGKVLHRALELGFCPRYEKIVKEVAMEMHVKLDDKVMARALREIDDAKKLYNQSELKRIVDSADFVKREVDVYKSFGNFVIEGKIDLLLKSGDEVLIVDYKSDNPREIERSIAERSYDRQLQLYGLCINKPKLAIYCIMDGRLRYIDIKDITGELENLSDRIIKREFEPDAQTCKKCDLKPLCMWNCYG
ncbi:MAG: UvrD-helicase domain-containing protein [Candidatus Thermoplasmatota archaeon]|nr:UvrD-helicase domain-containing protein [Candidatus Thermoplasmatota archaeon]